MKPFVTLPYSEESLSYTLGISTGMNVVDQKRNVISLEPGLQSIVSVTPQIFRTSEEFNALPISTRKCRLPHENFGLRFVNRYTKISCEFECAINKSISLCQCIPWFYTNNFTNVPICDMFGGNCFDQIMSNRKQYRECPSVCLDDCSETRLTWEKSFRPINIKKVCKKGSFLDRFFVRSAKQHLSFQHENKNVDEMINKDKMLASLCENFVKRYIGIVTVETPTIAIAKTIRNIRVSFMDQVGIIGGTLGVFTGISILSIVDLMVTMWSFFKKIKEKCEFNQDHQSNNSNSSDINPDADSNLNRIKKLEEKNKILMDMFKEYVRHQIQGSSDFNVEQFFQSCLEAKSESDKEDGNKVNQDRSR